MTSPRVRPHLPARPLWRCRVCAASWLCSPARLALRYEYAEDPVALAIYLNLQLFDAAADLHRLNPHGGPDPKTLFERFLAWTHRHSPPSRSGEARIRSACMVSVAAGIVCAVTTPQERDEFERMRLVEQIEKDRQIIASYEENMMFYRIRIEENRYALGRLDERLGA